MNVKRVLLAAHHYPPHRVGGAELLTQRIARWLTQQDIAVQVVCIENVNRAQATFITARDEMDGAVCVRRLDISLAPQDDLRLWFDSPSLRAQYDTLCDAWQPDVVHLISGYLMGVAPLEAAWQRQIPTVVTLTDFWFLCPTIQLLRTDGSLCEGPEPLECARCLSGTSRAFRLLDERAPALGRAFWSGANANPWLGARLHLPGQTAVLEKRHAQLTAALNRVDALLPLTHFVVAMHRQNGFSADIPITQIDCFDVGDFDAFEPRTAPREGIHFGYIGQITPVKGVDLLLRAFLQARRANPEKRIYLHIHGNMNAQSSHIEQLRQLAGNAPEIIFHGAYEHRRTLAMLDGLDAVIVPSLWYENVPRVILEAFAAQRPVIGTRVGGISEVVTDHVNGLLFERGNVDDLARVIRQVITQPEILSHLAQNIPPPRPLAQDMHSVLEMYERVQARHVRELMP